MTAAIFSSELTDEELSQISEDFKTHGGLSLDLALLIDSAFPSARTRTKPLPDYIEHHSSLNYELRAHLAFITKEALKKRKISKRDIEEAITQRMKHLRSLFPAGGAGFDAIIEMFTSEADEVTLRDFFDWLNKRIEISDPFLVELMHRT
ncbi:hypothetical protein [Corallococcus sp. AB038B]|uniref:hypothetical protein n=1 Tax=Corallococcus sp. AB038B TaxID=2316718 RepID=UPI001F2FF1C3|nr:hypothetical protein [Corallococcus sp. AB038B]